MGVREALARGGRRRRTRLEAPLLLSVGVAGRKFFVKMGRAFISCGVYIDVCRARQRNTRDKYHEKMSKPASADEVYERTGRSQSRVYVHPTACVDRLLAVVPCLRYGRALCSYTCIYHTIYIQTWALQRPST